MTMSGTKRCHLEEVQARPGIRPTVRTHRCASLFVRLRCGGVQFARTMLMLLLLGTGFARADEPNDYILLFLGGAPTVPGMPDQSAKYWYQAAYTYYTPYYKSEDAAIQGALDTIERGQINHSWGYEIKSPPVETLRRPWYIGSAPGMVAKRTVDWSQPVVAFYNSGGTYSYTLQSNISVAKTYRCPTCYAFRDPQLMSPTVTPECAAVGTGPYACNDKTCGPSTFGSPTSSAASSPKAVMGNPINFGNGAKTQTEVDYTGVGTFPVVWDRTYSSTSNRGWLVGPTLGGRWRHRYDRWIDLYGDSVKSAYLYRNNPNPTMYRLQAGAWVTDVDQKGQLTSFTDSGGTITGWQYINEGDEIELYSATGKLTSVSARSGDTHTLQYDSEGKLVEIRDAMGRAHVITYDSLRRVQTFSDPSSATTTYGYDSNGHLQTVQRPGGGTRTYLYGELQYTSNQPVPYLLTGINDEVGNRYATYTYDSSRRAIVTEHALGADKTKIQYSGSSASTVTDVLGTSRQLGFVNLLGAIRQSSASESCPTCGGVNTSSLTYDVNGNITSAADFRSKKTCYAYDTSRNLEIARVEGLPTSADCTASIANPPAGVDIRKITTTWHSTYRLPWVITEPAEGGTGVRTTTHTYDASGNLTEKTIVGPKNDGTSATTSRTWKWTYFSRGRVQAATDPNNKVTTTAYYADNHAEIGKRGNVSTVTNHLGHITTYNAYDSNGRPLTITDPNGLVTTFTYHPRGWLDTKTVGGEVTNYDYDAVGQLTLVTMPDGSTLSYDYDAAHRLTQIEDGLGNRIAYTLDGMGNRIREETYDPAGVLARTKQRVIDSLNREHQAIGAKETSFDDVPVSNVARVAIERIYVAGITSGCAVDPLRYCPDAAITRTQTAIFLLRAKYGSAYNPPSGTTSFVDVATHPYKDWIAKVVDDGLMIGRDATHFEPDATMRRDEMALSLVRLKNGAAYTPTPATGVFVDMSGNPFAAWAEQAHAQGITSGCVASPLQYCPTGSVTRASMALFFTRTIAFLPIPNAPSDQYCAAGTTYFKGNFGFAACNVEGGTCWSGTPFAGSTAVTGSTYPNTNYACATTPQMSSSIQSTLKAYDANGNPTISKDPLGRTTENTYDALNRLVSVIDPASGQTSYGYDPGGNLKTVQDPRGLITSYTYDGLRNQTKLDSPDTGFTSRTFDAAGNVLTSIDARGVTTTTGYDGLGRPLSVAHTKPGTTTETQAYTWDTGTNGKGRLAQIAEAGVTTKWTYTVHGRVQSKQQVVGSLTQTVGYAYNAAGQLDTLTTPSGQQIKYTYLNGRISSVKINGQTLAGGIVTSPFGPVGAWQWGNGLYSFRYYDKDGRLNKWEHRNGTTLLQNTLTWDLANRITAVNDPLLPSISGGYEYDALDRLRIARVAGSDVTAQEYGYDAVGNRLSRKVGIPATATTTYNYPVGSNRLISQTGAENRTFSYDGAGNPDAYGTSTFKHTYNNANRLVMVKNGSSTVATYVVNALGQRISKTVGSTTTRFVYDEQGRLLGEYSGTGVLIQETVWLDDLPIATLRPSGAGGTPTPINTYYVHPDHLGSPRAVTQPSDNAVRWRWDNTDAFGANAANETPTVALGAFKYGLRFPGQYHDAETLTHYNLRRDYDPDTGRFQEADPIGIRGGINTYSYSFQAPLMFVDPWGLAPSTICPNPNTCTRPPLDPTPDGPRPSPQPPSSPKPSSPGDKEFCAKNQPTLETCVGCCVAQAFRRGPHWVAVCKISCTDEWKITCNPLGPSFPIGYPGPARG